MAARFTCEARIGEPPPPVPLTKEEIIHRWAYLLEMRACLMSLGYEISDPPPLQRFIDTWATGPWSPYNDLADQTGQIGWEAANRECPQIEDP